MLQDHAIVIGASISGLITAHMLSHHYGRVSVLERDSLPEAGDFRAGVPQGRHVHLLLIRGARELETLFPGINQELQALGAQAVDMINDCRYYLKNGWTVPQPTELKTLSATRPLFDWAIRRRLLQNPKIQFLAQHDALNLIGNSRHIQGVQVRNRQDGSEQSLHADLVVDASGRNSKLAEWLGELGCGKVSETVLDAKLGYTSRLYAKPEGWKEWKGLFVMQQPPTIPKGAILLEVEGNRWIVTGGGVNHAKPPTDEAGFMQWLRELPSPILADLLSKSQPLSPTSGYGRTENRQRHYERMHLPAGVIALGDAVCAFNPVYGQGISTATLGAILLGTHLKEQDRGSAAWGQRFQQALAKNNQFPWEMASGEDSRYDSSFKRPFFSKLIAPYFDQINQASLNSNVVFTQFIKTIHLIDNPNALFHPRVFIPVLLSKIRPKYSDAVPNLPLQVNV
ncbi:MAG: FAD-dependent monooxygenase [Chloroflexi bacterium]|nr:FAD-dependent monooxygenase [Chloroflexota bacterium]